MTFDSYQNWTDSYGNKHFVSLKDFCTWKYLRGADKVPGSASCEWTGDCWVVREEVEVEGKNVVCFY